MAKQNIVGVQIVVRESPGVHPTQCRYQALSRVQPVDSIKGVVIVLLVQCEGRRKSVGGLTVRPDQFHYDRFWRKDPEETGDLIRALQTKHGVNFPVYKVGGILHVFGGDRKIE